MYWIAGYLSYTFQCIKNALKIIEAVFIQISGGLQMRQFTRHVG